MPLLPLAQLRLTKHHIPAWHLTPNTSVVNKPMLIYHSAFDKSSVTASAIEKHLRATNVVEPQWRYTMYSTSHFHSTSHEVLCISHGSAKLCFGHEDNPHRIVETVGKGDVIIVPAGVSHRLLEDVEGGFEMVGSYPRGCIWDMCYGEEGEEGKIKAIAGIRWFERDPVYGDQGPVLDV